GRAQCRPGGPQRGERLVDVPRPVLQLDDERNLARPRPEQGRESGVRDGRIARDPRAIAPDLRRHTEQDAAEAFAELAERFGQPADPLPRRPPHRADRRASLGLHAEAEVRGRRPDPAANRRRRRAAPERRVQLDSREPGRVGGEAIHGARSRGVEARCPVGIGEARRPDEQASGRSRQARPRVPQARPAPPAMVRSMTSSASPSMPDRKYSAMPRRWVGAAVRSRLSPASVSAASAPRRSLEQVTRATRPSSTSRSMSRVAPLFESDKESARRPMRRRRSGASARNSRATYSWSETPCSVRRSSSMRRETWAWARTKARHGARRGSRARRAGIEAWVAVGMLRESYGPARCAVNERRNTRRPSG